MADAISRRDFVFAAGSLGAIWLLADSQEVAEAAHHAVHQLSQSQPTLLVLTQAQAVEVEAFASRIIPTDETPGAHEAGVLYFIDRALTRFAADLRPMFEEGIAKLERDVAAKFPGQTKLSALTPAQQDEVLKSIEDTPFFGQMRFATLAGFFALPTHGGNRDFVGWKLVGQESAMEFRAPFGWYDQPANRRTLLGGGA